MWDEISGVYGVESQHFHCIYIAPLSKALYNVCLSFTHSLSHSHTNGDWLPCKVPTSSSGAVGD